MAHPGNKKTLPKRGPGRPKGAANLTTRQVKDSILTCFESIGGIKAFTTWAKANPTEFYSRILPRLIPTEITGNDGGPIVVKFELGGIVVGVGMDE